MTSTLLLSLALAAAVAPAAADATSPVGKAISMISDLEAKVLKDGEMMQKEFEEFSEWCEERNRNLDHEIQTGESQVAALKATIEEEKATSSSLESKVEELASGIAGTARTSRPPQRSGRLSLRTSRRRRRS